jgi:hypothetical protein
MTTTIIRNNFHNSQYRTYKSHAEIRSIIDTHPRDRSHTEKQFIARCRKALCGISDCACGGELSERGRQDYDQD